MRKNPKRAIKPNTLYEVSKVAIHYIWKKGGGGGGGEGEGWRRVSVGKVRFSFSKTAKNESDQEKKKTKANLKYLFEVFPELEMVGQKHCRAIIRRVGKPDSSQELKYLVYITRMPSIQIRKPKGGQKFYTRRRGVVSQCNINEHYSDS